MPRSVLRQSGGSSSSDKPSPVSQKSESSSGGGVIFDFSYKSPQKSYYDNDQYGSRKEWSKPPFTSAEILQKQLQQLLAAEPDPSLDQPNTPPKTHPKNHPISKTSPKAPPEKSAASAQPTPATNSKIKYDYYAVVDFECTCQSDNTGWEHEIIEFVFGV